MSTMSILLSLQIHLQDTYNVRVDNGIFLNLYKDGEDYCPYHRDQYGKDVYTISLGATRDLLLKPDEKGKETEKYTLKSGDMYYMANELHKTHRHSIPKRKNMNQTRISVVFFTRPSGYG
jgi:alkylated DNA repair dioxygenase AlkB